MMRKVLFLMIMLFLMGLGTASVKAQVRIGANTLPHPTAILDLNADNTSSTGTKGLALPRVVLTSDTMQLTSGVSNVNGLLVYNNSVNIGPRGMYFWNGASGRWIQASLPTTTAADSGKFLFSNGSAWVQAYLTLPPTSDIPDALTAHPAGIGFSIAMILDTVYSLTVPLPSLASIRFRVQGLLRDDWCFSTNVTAAATTFTANATAGVNTISLRNYGGFDVPAASATRLRCLRLVS